MEKRAGLTIMLMVVVVMGGLVYANVPQTGTQQNTATPNGATSVAFENHGNSWKHVVAAFDITNVDGSIKKIYADLWVKPQGTATVDLSSLAGLNNQSLPAGTNVQLKTYTVPNVPTAQVPQGVTDNKVTATADPSQGGKYLAALTPSTSAADPVVVTPRNTVVVNDTSFSITTGGGVSVSGTAAVPLCANAGGASAQAPTNGTAVASTPGVTAQAPLTGPVVASTPRLRIVLPL
jgi:FlaG/FlaF family flagellin (archaellin)